LAARSAVSRNTVRGFEGGQHDLRRATAAAIRRAFEAAGVVLEVAIEDGTGLRLLHAPGGA